MKNAASRATNALATLSLAALLLPCGARGQGVEVLSNESVVQMVTGKVPKGLIVTKIESTTTAFDVTPRGLVGLHTSKVPTDVIKLMMKVAASPESKEILTNDDVIFMVTNQLPRDVILLKIQSTKGGYDLTATGLVNLNQNKVHQDLMKAMMAPPGPPSVPPRVVPPTQSSGAAVTPTTDAASNSAPNARTAASLPAVSKPRKLIDGETAVIKTALSHAAATAKVKAYFGGKDIDFTVNQETGTLVSDWYNERGCGPGFNRCANRANVRVVSQDGQVVVRVQVFERKREAGANPKPWNENSKNKGKETGELADALEAYVIK